MEARRGAAFDGPACPREEDLRGDRLVALGDVAAGRRGLGLHGRAVRIVQLLHRAVDGAVREEDEEGAVAGEGAEELEARRVEHVAELLLPPEGEGACALKRRELIVSRWPSRGV